MKKFQHINAYPASPEQVLAMLTDQSFRDQVGVAQGALENSVEVTGSGVGAEVSIQQKQATQGVPSFAKKVAGDSVEVVHREHWTSPTTADFSIVMPGKPGELKGTVTLRPTADGCEQVYDGEVKVGIPLIGGKLEGLIETLMKKAFREEGRTGVAWLAEGQS